jgi:hypothetical protein
MFKKTLPYMGAIVILICCLYIFSISSNVTTLLSQQNYQTDQQLYDTIGVAFSTDNRNHPELFNLIYHLPFAMTILFIVVQTVDLIITKGRREFIIEAIFAESISMLLKGLMQILTILPDSNPHNIYCHKPPPSLYSLNLDSCSNMIWSGHTTHIILAVYWLDNILEKYINDNMIGLFRVSTSFIILFEVIMIVIFQIHYSVDVVLAMLFIFLLLKSHPFIQLVDYYRCRFGISHLSSHHSNVPVSDQQIGYDQQIGSDQQSSFDLEIGQHAIIKPDAQDIYVE